MHSFQSVENIVTRILCTHFINFDLQIVIKEREGESLYSDDEFDPCPKCSNSPFIGC